MQLAGKRHFVHEHPEGSTAFAMPEFVEFLARPEVGMTTLHMCAYGMEAADENGKGLVKKPTRIVSSSAEVLSRVEARCTNEQGGDGTSERKMCNERLRRSTRSGSEEKAIRGNVIKIWIRIMIVIENGLMKSHLSH